MNSLKSLQFLINFFYYGFLVAACLYVCLFVFTPGGSINSLLIELSRTGLEGGSIKFKDVNLLTLSLNILRIGLFFSILYFFRKVVLSFVVGDLYNYSTRRYFKFMGIISLILGVLKLFMRIYIPYSFGKGLTIFSLNFEGFESCYFIMAIGLLFIYISNVLEQSAILEAENRLTI